MRALTHLALLATGAERGPEEPRPPGVPPPYTGHDAYGQYHPPYYQQQPQKVQAPNAITILVLTILTFLMCQPLAAIPFFMAKREMEAYPTCEMTKVCYYVSMIVMIVGLVTIVLGVLYMAFWFTLMGSLMSGAGGPFGPPSSPAPSPSFPFWFM